MLKNELHPGESIDLGGGRIQRRGVEAKPNAITARDVLDIPKFQARPDLRGGAWNSEGTLVSLKSLAQSWDELDDQRQALADRLSRRLETPPEDLGISKAGGRLKQELTLLRTEIDLRRRTDEIREVMLNEAKEESQRRVDRIMEQRKVTEAAIVGALESAGVEKHLFDDRMHVYVPFSKPVQEAMSHARKMDHEKTRLMGMAQAPFIRNCESRIESIRLRLVDMC